MVTIAAQTHGTAPISRTARIPATGSQTFLPSEVAAAWSPVTVTLSGMGITSDATGGLYYGASAPAGSTGQEAAINAALAAAWTASGGQGLRVVWDVAVALGGPIYFPGSYTEIVCPTKACGAILLTNANCPIIRSPGTNADMTISTNTQNTFGKYDPSPPGGQPPGNYRVFDQTFVGSQKLSIRGGTWNGNRANQSSQITTAYGWTSVFQLWGIDGLQLYDMDVFLASVYHIHVLNVRDFEYGNILIQSTNGGIIGNDGLHINGPSTGIRGGHIRIHTNDDHLALNADDQGDGGGIVSGTNFACGGDIVNAVVCGPDLFSPDGSSQPNGCVRLLSTYHRIDNVIIQFTTGSNTNIPFLMYPYPSLCPGIGNYGHVTIRDDSHDTNGGSGSFIIGGDIDFLDIQSRYRYNAQAHPDIQISTAQIVKLHVEWNGYQPAGASNNTQPAMLITNAHIQELKFTGSIKADSSITTRAAPFIITTNDTPGIGGVIDFCEMDVMGDAITNLVNHTSTSTIGTLIIRGIHSNAGGGSPVAVASGATITNLCVAGAGGNLAYVTANGANSGSGTVTNTNTYSGP